MRKLLIGFLLALFFLIPADNVKSFDLIDAIGSGCRPGCSACCPPGDEVIHMCSYCTTISELCNSNDPLLNYNKDKKECYCPKDYSLDEKSGTKKCLKVEQGLTLEVSRNEPKGSDPLLADGITKATYIVKGIYAADNSTAELDIQLAYLPDQPLAKIDVFRMYDDKQVWYQVTYTTPNLLKEENPRLTDEFIIEYPTYSTKDIGNKEFKVKRHKISLTNIKEESLGAVRGGFNDGATLLKGNTAGTVKVFAYTANDGEKIPVAGAEIDLSGIAKKVKTNKRGFAELEVKNIENDEVLNIEVELKLLEEIQKNLDNAKIYYRQSSAKNQIVEDWLNDFSKVLSQETSEEKIENLVSALETVAYSLVFIADGERYADRLSDGVGSAVGQVTKEIFDFVWGIIDMGGQVTKHAEKVGSKVMWKGLGPEKMGRISGFLTDLPDKYSKGAWDLLCSMYSGVNPDTPPGILKLVYKHTFGKLKGLSWDKAWKIKENISLISVQSAVKEKYVEAYNLFSQDMIDIVAETIKTDSFIQDEQFKQLQIVVTQRSYKNFVESRLEQNETTYKTAKLTIWANLIEENVLLLAKIYATAQSPTIHTYRAIDKTCKAADGFYKAVMGVMSIKVVNMWSNAYDYNMSVVRNSVYSMMGVGYIPREEKVSRKYLTKAVYADTGENEKDILDILYENEVPADHPDRKLALEYHEAQITDDLYSYLSEGIAIIAEEMPDDKEVQETKQSIDATLSEVKTFISQNESKVKKLEILDSDYIPSKTDIDWSKITSIAIGILAFLIFIFLLRKKAFRKTLIVIILILAVVVIVVFVDLPSLGDGLNKLKDKVSNITKKDDDKTNQLPKIESSSFLPSEENFSYHPKMAYDDDLATAWVEGNEDEGVDEWIQFDFDKKKEISELKIMPGYASSENIYFKNNRIRQLRVEFSSDPAEFFTLNDEFRNHTLKFDPVATSYVRIVIVDVYRGDQFNDTAISEISFN